MAIHTPPHKAHPSHDVPTDDPEPGMLPVEPDTGPLPPGVPLNPEKEPADDPEA